MKQILPALVLCCCQCLQAQEIVHDSSFNQTGWSSNNYNSYFSSYEEVVANSDSTIFASGDVRGSGLLLAKYKYNGTYDSTFGISGVAIYGNSNPLTPDEYSVHAMEVNENGKIFIAGSLTQFGYDWGGEFIARFNPDGTIDTSFGINGLTEYLHYYSHFDDIALQDDGMVIGVGQYLYWELEYDSTISYIIRYDTNGLPDSSFAQNGLFEPLPDTWLQNVSLTNDGKIVSSGITLQDGTYKIFAMRLLTNGSPDTAFGQDGTIIHDVPGLELSGTSMELQDDGKIVFTCTLGGESPDMPNSILIGRLNVDGSFDSTFNAVGYTTISHDPDILFARDLVIDAEGNILTNGYMKDPANGVHPFITRHSPGGSVDSAFNLTGMAYNFTPWTEVVNNSFALQNDYKIVYAGCEWSGNDTCVSFIGRLQPSDTVTPSSLMPEIPEPKITVYPNPSNGLVTIDNNWSHGQQGAEITIFNQTGIVMLQTKVVTGNPVIDISNFPPGIYIISLKDGKTLSMAKLVCSP